MKTLNTDEFSVEKIIVVPPDGGWGWVVVAAAFLCILIMDGIANTFGLLIPIFQDEFHASVSQISLINSLFTGFYFIFAPLAGSLSNRFGFRPVIIAGSIISALGIAVSIFTQSIQLMFVTYGLVGGLGFSMMYINVVLTVGFYFEKWRALATGITVSASGVGTLTFAPVVQILLEKFTWRQIFIGYSGAWIYFIALSYAGGFSVFGHLERPPQDHPGVEALAEPRLVSPQSLDSVAGGRPSWRFLIASLTGMVLMCSFIAICFRPLPPIALQDPNDIEKPRKPGKKLGSMHNTRYPTAAKAVDLNQLRGSKLSLIPSWYSSMESLEIAKYASKNPSRKPSRNVDMKRRPTEYSQFQSAHDLTIPGSTTHPKRCWCWYLMCSRCKFLRCYECCKQKKQAGVRPLYRDDIFYEGSVVQLPMYERNSAMARSSPRQSTVTKNSFLYNLSVTRLPTHRDVEQERDAKCHLFPESMTRALKTMFDFRVMKFPLFILFTISTCFLATGVNVPSYFTYVRAVEMGVMNQNDASLILSAIGITNTVGRIICGIIGSVPKINIIILHFGFLFFGALLNICVVFLHTKVGFFIYAALYGLVLAEQGSLRSVILVQLVGLENLTNAFGILLLFLGIFTVVGTPTAGFMKELTGSYDAVFFFSSLFLLLAAAALIPIFVGKFKLRNQNLHGSEVRERVILPSASQNVLRTGSSGKPNKNEENEAEETVEENGIATTSAITQTQSEAHQALASFWPRVNEEIKKIRVMDLKVQALPLARIKKIMKLDEDVKMISAEAPMLFAKAAEMFIHELTLRAWIHTEDNKRRTLQRNDIAMAITKYDQFDFLIDIVPREELKPNTVKNETTKTTSVNSDQVHYYFQLAQQHQQALQNTSAENTNTTQTITPAPATTITNTVQAPSTGQVLQTPPAGGGLQIVHQIVTPSGDVQSIPVQLTPQQLQLLRMQLQNNSNQPVILQTGPVQVSANNAIQVAPQGTQVFIAPTATPAQSEAD